MSSTTTTNIAVIGAINQILASGAIDDFAIDNFAKCPNIAEAHF